MSWSPTYAIQNSIKVNFNSASIHPFAAGISYGATVFECIRAYKAYDGSLNIFRLDDHISRIANGMRFMRFGNGPTTDALRQGVIDSVKVNDPNDDAFIRLHVYLSDVAAGIVSNCSNVEWTCGATPRARSKSYHSGSSLQVSSWVKPHDISAPARIKATANYHMARIAMLQAKADGYDNALLLTKDGKLSESTGAAVFLIKNKILITPPFSSDVLESITTDTVFAIARDMDLEVQQRVIDRTEIYCADEMFVCGTGAEIEPVVGVDRFSIGNGLPGILTQKIQNRYERIVRGAYIKYTNWLIPV